MGRGGKRERSGGRAMAEEARTRARRDFGVDDEEFGEARNYNEVDKVETGCKKKKVGEGH